MKEEYEKAMDRRKNLYKVEDDYEWRKWTKEIPFIQFLPQWEIQIIPPFGGAVARFCIKKGKFHCSIYLDCYGELGFYGKNGTEPYWEIYPHNGDVARCGMKDTKTLIKLIKESIRSQGDKDEV